MVRHVHGTGTEVVPRRGTNEQTTNPAPATVWCTGERVVPGVSVHVLIAPADRRVDSVQTRVAGFRCCRVPRSRVHRSGAPGCGERRLGISADALASTPNHDQHEPARHRKEGDQQLSREPARPGLGDRPGHRRRRARGGSRRGRRFLARSHSRRRRARGGCRRGRRFLARSRSRRRRARGRVPPRSPIPRPQPQPSSSARPPDMQGLWQRDGVRRFRRAHPRPTSRKIHRRWRSLRAGSTAPRPAKPAGAAADPSHAYPSRTVAVTTTSVSAAGSYGPGGSTE